MNIDLQIAFEASLGDGDLLFDFVALPGGAAAAVVAGSDGTYSLVTIAGARVARTGIDGDLVDGVGAQPRYFERAVLARVGAGFALVSPAAATRWTNVDAVPKRFSRVDSFPRNAQGFTVEISSGASSDAPDTALLLLRDPQIVDSVTRFALLRFDETRAVAQWDGLGADGDPRRLRLDEIPPTGPAKSPILYHGDWRGGRLRLFCVGYNGNFERWGCDFSADCEFSLTGQVAALVRCPDNTLGTYSASGRWLMLNPLRGTGGTSLVDLATRRVFAPRMPRGCAKYRVADHAGEHYWLRSPRGQPLRLVAAIDKHGG